MRTAAILPVKRFAHAKQRLGESVADPLRAQLARAMVGDVLSALRECAALDLTIVVTSERSVAAGKAGAHAQRRQLLHRHAARLGAAQDSLGRSGPGRHLADFLRG